MLKQVSYEGLILVDLKKEKPSKFELEKIIQESIKSNGIPNIFIYNVRSRNDIPSEWINAVPYGDRTDSKKCIEILVEEILPTIGEDDPNQMKFGFWKKRNE